MGFCRIRKFAYALVLWQHLMHETVLLRCKNWQADKNTSEITCFCIEWDVKTLTQSALHICENKVSISLYNVIILCCHHCFDTVGLASGRASGLQKIEWSRAGVVICLQLGANDLYMVQLMPLSPIISCFIKIEIGLTSLVVAYPGCPGKRC